MSFRPCQRRRLQRPQLQLPLRPFLCLVFGAFLLAFKAAALLFGLAFGLKLALLFDNLVDFLFHFRLYLIGNVVVVGVDFAKARKPWRLPP